MTHLEDSKIISLFYERSEQAIAELERKYGAAVVKTASNILSSKQDVEECANDTYLGVWNTIPPQNPNPFISYVCKIARNIATLKFHSNTAIKRNGQYDLVLDELEECIPSAVNVESDYEAKELSDAISHFLDTLKYEDRFFFIRRYWYADSVSDIAAMTQRDSHLISVHLFRTREKLYHYLKEEGLLV